MAYEDSPPLANAPPSPPQSVPSRKHRGRQIAQTASVGRAGSAECSGGGERILLVVVIAVAAPLLLILLAAVVMVRVDRIRQPWPAKGPDDVGERRRDPAGQDERGDDSNWLGEDKQAERHRRLAEEAREKQRREKADQEKKGEERKTMEKEAAAMAAAQKQKEENDRAEGERARKELAERRAAAYAALSALDGITEQNLPVARAIDEGIRKEATICSLAADALLDLSLDLAVPSDPLSENEPFEAFIEAASDQPMMWKLLWRQRGAIDFTESSEAVSLATIVVKNGKLVLTPSSREILSEQAFSHLRRSVLLVKARNPDEPAAPVGVVKAIQLVRPTSVGPFAVSLLGGPKSFALPLPPGITVADKRGEWTSNLPQDTTVDYEVACDYDIDGNKRPTVRQRTESLAEPPVFHELLKCPPDSRVPSNPPTWIGLKVRFGNGDVGITPESSGPGARIFDANELNKYVSRSDQEFKVQTELKVNGQLKRVERFCVTAVDEFRPLEFEKVVGNHKSEADRPGFPAQWKQDHARIMLSIAGIAKVGTQVQVPAADGGVKTKQVTREDWLREVLPHQTEWKKVFCDPLRNWVQQRAEDMRTAESQTRQCLKPLVDPARVIIRSITCKVFDRDSNRYSVTLLRGDSGEDAHQETPPGTRNSGAKPSL